MLANALKKGMSIIYEGDLYLVVDAQFYKPGKGGGMMRTKLKSVKKGTGFDKTFSTGDFVEEASVAYRHVQFSYADEEGFHFMDLETYETRTVSEDVVGDVKGYLIEGMEVDIQLHEEEVISVNVPTHVVLEVTYTEPGFKGDTSSGAVKPATLETGISVNVPLFVEIGDKLKIDTRDNSYVERAK